ncbi:hypothetical protein ACFST9_24825 [Hymenobacter monticola]|uniref:DUF1877 family protein n=1 Tax=Hymenobacter monticola TaxID=1705399 RepID=A0ABY4B6L7_9BACT|nr:hypothetical protein [Hymenobacter monticola]UOE34804.1 hypothetical protein MTP16_03910 [Hymenobacter monticola]
MGATCSLQQISQEAAEAYVRQPILLVKAQQAEHEDFSRQWHPRFDFTLWNEARKQRLYDWVVLVKGLLSLSSEAYQLGVHGGQQVGGLEESWQLEGDAKVFNPEQVATLYQAMASVSLSPADEHNEEYALMVQDFQRFLKEAAETGKALLLFVGP